jgi:hypothetical protein
MSVRFIRSLIHLVVCLMTGPKPLPKRALHIVRSRASSFKWEYPHLFLRSSNSFLRLLPRLPVTFIPPFIFPSITRFRRQFLRKMWPVQFAFRLRISCRIFLCSLTPSNNFSFLTWSVQLIFSNSKQAYALDVPSLLYLYIQKEYVFEVSHNTTWFCCFYYSCFGFCFRPSSGHNIYNIQGNYTV